MSQHMEALALANETRIEGARFRRYIRGLSRADGCATLVEMLVDPDMPDYIGAMYLRRYLGCARSIGTAKIASLFEEADMQRRDPRVRDLTQRECRALARALLRCCDPPAEAA